MLLVVICLNRLIVLLLVFLCSVLVGMCYRVLMKWWLLLDVIECWFGSFGFM